MEREVEGGKYCRGWSSGRVLWLCVGVGVVMCVYVREIDTICVCVCVCLCVCTYMMGARQRGSVFAS